MTAFLEAGIDRSGVTVVGNVQVAPANENRRGLTIQNTSDTDFRVTENGVAATANTGYYVKAGTAINISTNRGVNLYCGVAGKSFAATEF